MNLKSKLTLKATATVKFTSDTQAIFSDECTNSHINALTILTADNKQALWDLVVDKATTDASTTRFAPVIIVITPSDEQIIFKPVPKKPLATQPVHITDPQEAFLSLT